MELQFGTMKKFLCNIFVIFNRFIVNDNRPIFTGKEIVQIAIFNSSEGYNIKFIKLMISRKLIGTCEINLENLEDLRIHKRTYTLHNEMLETVGDITMKLLYIKDQVFFERFIK